jgi:Zn-dependent peptidase ImmA (M78 family)
MQGIRGIRTAKKIIENYCFDNIQDINLEGVIHAESGFIQYKPLKGAQGQIVMNKNNAIITVNSNIVNKQKQRFVLAHELGHLLMHKNANRHSFNCDINAFLDWNSKRIEETEANLFAAELLMPSTLFKAECRKHNRISLAKLQSIAELFQTSITSTLIKFVDSGTHPTCLVFIKNGIIKWSRFSSDFPLNFINSNVRPLVGTVAREIIDGDDIPLHPEKVNALDWFGDDYNIEKYQNWRFNEECFCIPQYNTIISLIWCN